jgi:hypothetical protein
MSRGAGMKQKRALAAADALSVWFGDFRGWRVLPRAQVSQEARSARRPGHGPSAKKMKVEMVYRLSAILTCIHDNAIPIAETFLAGNLRRDPMQMSQHRPVRFAGVTHGADVLAGDD